MPRTQLAPSVFSRLYRLPLHHHQPSQALSIRSASNSSGGKPTKPNNNKEESAAQHFHIPDDVAPSHAGPEPGKVSSIPPVGKGMDPDHEAVSLKNEGTHPRVLLEDWNEGDEPVGSAHSCGFGAAGRDQGKEEKSRGEDVKRGWVE